MYNNDSNSLNAGAPDIRLSGNQQMASMEAGQEGTLEDIYQELLGMGFSPEEAAKRAREFYNDMSSQAPQQNSGIMAAAPRGTYTQNRKDNMMAYGGIAGADGRKKYGIGSWFQEKIMDPIKENPVTTALLGGALANQFDVIPGDMSSQNWLGDLLGGKDAVLGPGGSGDKLIDFGNLFGTGSNVVNKELERVVGGYPNPDLDPTSLPEELSPFRKALATILPFGDPGYVEGGLYNTMLGGGDGSALSPYLGEGEGRRVNPLYPLGIGAAVGKYVEGLPKDELPMDTTSIDPAAIAAAARGTDAEGAAAGLRFLPPQVARAAQGGRIGYQDAGDVDPEYNGWKKVYETNPDLAKMHDNHPKYLERYESEGKAQGGRIGAQEGGLMDLGGMEKDYRNEGGFVALGGEEKADDVPARLSKNEFVFTADAVRGAGGGDIDKGAEIMEDLMKRLEGARGMFANAQQLEKRII